jgi:flagellar basal-body rod protein FlgG
MYLATSGALAYEKRLQMISNNLANANTAGFKMDRSHFKIYDPDALPSQTEPIDAGLAASRAPLFWMELNMYTDFSGGPLKSTGNPFDLALNGDGFFCIQKPDGVYYTRKGDFTLNSEGVLVTGEGWPVMGEGGAIVIDAAQNAQRYARFAVDAQGSVSVDGSRVDTLRVVHFDQPQQLIKAGDTLFKAPPEGLSERPADNFSISQGFIEQSNVDSVKMLTEMIEVLRGYESYQKVIRSADEASAKAINEVGRI